MAFGQITITSLQASHPENFERRQVRDFARQRAKVVVVEVESLQVLHAEQLGRHIRQIHAYQLKTTCESGATCKSSTHLDHNSVVLDAFLDDAFRRLAAKNQLSHCKQANTTRRTQRQSAHSAPRAERTTLKLQNSDKCQSLEHACQLRRAELKSSIAHC